MQDILTQISEWLPSTERIAELSRILLILAAAFLIIGFIGKLCFGKNSNLNRALSTAIGILFLYATAVLIHIYNPWNLSRYLSPLPFVAFSGNGLYLFSFAGTRFPVICSQVLSMVTLAFLYNLIDDFMPRGKKLHWLLYRFLTVVMTMALHYVVTWLTHAFLPGSIVSYAPTILLVVFICMLFLGVLKVILGLVLAVVNPFLAAVYTFFFSNKVGRQLSRAAVTTLLLSVFIMVLQYCGYGVISVAAVSLVTYIPVFLVLLILWYVIGVLF